MTNALTLITPNDILTTARALIASGFLPRSIDTVDKAFAIITMSSGLGIDMWQGFNGINVIQGKPTVSPQLMLGLINRSGQIEDMVITATADAATVTMKRRGRTPHTEVFSIKDAAAQGLTGKDNYKKQPAVMLKWRAVAACARVVFPDIIMGLYTTEELAPDNTTLTADGEAAYTAPITVERPAEPAPELFTFEIDTVTHSVTSKDAHYYHFGDGVFTYSRDPFRDAGVTECESWVNLPLDIPSPLLDKLTVIVKQKSADRFEVVSVNPIGAQS